MKLKETRILDAEGARYACIANHYCTRCDCEEYDRILTDADSSSRKPGGITVDDLARIAEAIKAVSEMNRIGGKYCMVTMCIGGGMGAAGIFEAV